jgi:hypothetical protein
MATNEDIMAPSAAFCKPGAHALIVGVMLYVACILRDDIPAAGAVLLLVPSMQPAYSLPGAKT